MSKLYEVLENASRERQGLATGPAQQTVVRPEYSRVETEMIGLYQALSALLTKKGCRVIQFMGTREGEGCSTVVRDLARTSATRMRESVLLLDLNRPVGEDGFACDANLQYHFEEICSEEASIERSLYQLDQRKGFSNPFPLNPDIGVDLSDRTEESDLWLRARNQFTMVLIDSPPATESPIGFSHFKHVDGVVLVIREEKTRWPVATSIKEKITREGGNVIGAVYNDRRYYIPQWLYRKL